MLFHHCSSAYIIILNFVAIKTKAVRKNGDLIINGGKMWTTNGCQADWMCLLANTREGPPHKNKSLICLPLNLPGIYYYYYCSHLKREMLLFSFICEIIF